MTEVLEMRRWEKEIQCTSCQSRLKVSEDDILSHGAFGRASEGVGIEYYSNCPCCQHKVVLEVSPYDDREAELVPPHVKKKAREKERQDILLGNTP